MMKSGIKYEQGDLVIVPFPFSDLTSVKQRPVLILSREDYNNKTEDVITCGITSNLRDELHSVLIDNQNLVAGTLVVKSRIKVDKIFTVHQSIIRKKLGRINRETSDVVKKELFNLI